MVTVGVRVIGLTNCGAARQTRTTVVYDDGSIWFAVHIYPNSWHFSRRLCANYRLQFMFGASMNTPLAWLSCALFVAFCLCLARVFCSPLGNLFLFLSPTSGLIAEFPLCFRPLFPLFVLVLIRVCAPFGALAIRPPVIVLRCVYVS